MRYFRDDNGIKASHGVNTRHPSLVCGRELVKDEGEAPLGQEGARPQSSFQGISQLRRHKEEGDGRHEEDNEEG